MPKESYTTGTHASAIFKSALVVFLEKIKPSDGELISVPIPNGTNVSVKIDRVEIAKGLISASTRKTDNDDIDVTKGTPLICHLSSSFVDIKDKLSPIAHKPHSIDVGAIKIFVYAGRGLGVATRNGLKVKPSYPAINPAPLSMFKVIALKLLGSADKINTDIYTLIEIPKGLKLADKTANPKIGILGGISIIGSTGIVKPISSAAYKETIKTYISVAKASSCKTVIYTVGDSAYKFASKRFVQQSDICVEIGNFVYDALKMLENTGFLELYLVLSIGKMTKLAQGFKNTHMHYGQINMQSIKDLLITKHPSLGQTIGSQDFNTTKSIIEYLDSYDNSNDNELTNAFYKLIINNALDVLAKWACDIKLSIKTIHTMLLLDKAKYISLTKNL